MLVRRHARLKLSPNLGDFCSPTLLPRQRSGNAVKTAQKKGTRSHEYRRSGIGVVELIAMLYGVVMVLCILLPYFQLWQHQALFGCGLVTLAKDHRRWASAGAATQATQTHLAPTHEHYSADHRSDLLLLCIRSLQLLHFNDEDSETCILKRVGPCCRRLDRD